MVRRIYKKLTVQYLPIYLRLWPSYYWLALWDTGSLRITLRHGPHQDWIMTLKKGDYDDPRKSKWHKEKLI